jgi:hypothetical protein
MENKNLTHKDVVKLIEKLPYAPMYNDVFITINTETEDGGELSGGNLIAERQFVLAKGVSAREVEPGMEVLLDIEKMMVKEADRNNPYESIEHIKLKPLNVDGQIIAIIDERMIKAKLK